MLKRILIFFCGIFLAVGVPLIKERNEDVEVLKSTEHRYSDFYAFQYSLSDGQHRQEVITFDEDDKNGISVRGSYNLLLEDGSAQTIFYVSDTSGHRISIGQPFTESEITQKPIIAVRRAPTRQKLETERNLKQEKIEDRTEKFINDEDDFIESELTTQKFLKLADKGSRRKL